MLIRYQAQATWMGDHALEYASQAAPRLRRRLWLTAWCLAGYPAICIGYFVTGVIAVPLLLFPIVVLLGGITGLAALVSYRGFARFMAGGCLLLHGAAGWLIWWFASHLKVA
jgi:hypothetical protein